MKLTSLALSNIKHNMKNYTMYFFAMCFCVFTTYTFANLIFSESVYEKLLFSEKYQSIFLGFGVAVMVFVLFFLISSNNSFIRYRKKEISTYALFGMENRKIGQLLFFETMTIGIAAMIVGIALGMFFSKLIAMILLRMMLADYANVAFNIEVKALIITAVTYIAIFCLMGISGFRTINKFQLVDLFKGDRVSEKRTTGSYVLLVLSLLLIGMGYYLASSNDGYKVASNMLLVIGITVLGSYLFFIGGLQKALYLIKKNKGFLYKKTRIISISLLSHKARTFATTMGTIAVLIATSVTAMAFGYTLYQSAENNAKEINSFDVGFYSNSDELEGKIYDLLEKYDKEPLAAIKFQRYVCAPEIVNITDGYAKYFTGPGANCMSYSESTFNSIVGIAHDSNTPLQVNEGEILILYPNYQADITEVEGTVIFGDSTYSASFEPVYNSYNFGTMLTVIFNDADFDKLMNNGYICDKIGDEPLWPYTGINYEDALSSRQLAKELKDVMSTASSVSYRILYDTYIEGMELFGLICFIGYFVCAVFILMSVSLLYFKQVAIGTEEISQYERLRKVGMDREQESKAIRNRIAPVFFIPLLMGLIHSVFAMKGADTIIFSNMIMSQGSTYMEVLKISSVMYLIYSAIYFAFYLITKYKYVRVVLGK